MYVTLMAIAALLLLLMKDRPPIGDETVHAHQVDTMLRWLTAGEPVVAVHPAFPGYHLLLATFAFLTGESGVPFLRALSL